jgi:hypothetical protein
VCPDAASKNDHFDICHGSQRENDIFSRFVREETPRLTEALHPRASHNLLSFITSPGKTDTLTVVMRVFLLLAVLMFGVIYFRRHGLPERLAQKSQ